MLIICDFSFVGVTIAGESGHGKDYVPENTLLRDNSHWASRSNENMGDEPGFIVYDLQRPSVVTRIGFRGVNRSQCVKDMILQTSDAKDGPWTDALRFTSRKSVEMQHFDVPAVPRGCQFWRLLIVNNHGETKPTICKFVFTEIQFFGAIEDSLYLFLCPRAEAQVSP